MRTGCAATPSLWMSVTISLRLWICCQDQHYDGPILPPSERNVQSITARPYPEQTMSCQGDVMPSHNPALRPLMSREVYETLKKCKPDLESYYDHIYNLELLLSDMIPTIYHFFDGYWHFFFCGNLTKFPRSTKSNRADSSTDGFGFEICVSENYICLSCKLTAGNGREYLHLYNPQTSAWMLLFKLICTKEIEPMTTIDRGALIIQASECFFQLKLKFDITLPHLGNTNFEERSKWTSQNKQKF